MDIEFHYYITRLIAARAGFSNQDARIVAWSSQYTDDNNTIYDIDRSLPTEYNNYICQTMDITKPRENLLRIYPLFHFIPGTPSAPAARRRDGSMHCLNTTPDSVNARLVMDAALHSDNLYRIGIACHAYADTWAHQNFLGYKNQFNAMKGTLVMVIPNIGHADALNKPDLIALKWNDERLVKNSIDNNERFLKAAVCMFRRLAVHADPEITGKELRKRKKKLKDDIKSCIDPGEDKSENSSDDRIGRYRKLSCETGYGGSEMDPYDEKLWMNEAVIREEYRPWDWSVNTRPDTDTADKENYFWKDRDRYKQTHWHLFQEAVKEHQNSTWRILENRNFKGLDLKDL
jgi:hypothetical protein